MRKMLLPILLILFLSACQLGIPEPPKPNLTVNDKKIAYEIGSYSWHENGKGVEADTAGPDELVENTTPAIVPAGSELTINFSYQPSRMEVGIWESGNADFIEVKNNKIIFPQERGIYTYVITARWKEGDATYAFRIDTK